MMSGACVLVSPFAIASCVRDSVCANEGEEREKEGERERYGTKKNSGVSREEKKDWKRAKRLFNEPLRAERVAFPQTCLLRFLSNAVSRRMFHECTG